MKKILLSLVLLTASLGLKLQAQNLLFFNQTNSQAHLVKFNGGGPSQGFTNGMIQRLAQGNNSSVNQTEWVIVHDEVLRMTQKSLNSYNVSVAIKDLRITGTKSYKGMDMTREMLPSVVNVEVQVTSESGQVLETRQLTNVALQGNPISIVEFTVTDTSGNFLKNRLQLVNKQFIYSQQDWNEFKQRTDLTDQYFQDIRELERIQAEIRTVNPGAFEVIDQEQTKLQGLEQQVEAIGQKDYVSKLRLKRGEDPGDFQATYNAALEEAALMREQLDKTLARLPILYFERGLAKQDNGNIRGAKRDFNRALQYDAQFAPAAVALADLDAMEGNRRGAVERIRTVFSTMSPSPQTESAAYAVLARILDSHIMEAKDLISQGAFDGALMTLNAGGQLPVEFPGMGSPLEFDNTMRDAHMGIFRSRLAAAQNFLQQKDYPAAMNVVQEALAYQEQHAGYIGGSTEGQVMEGRIVNAQYADLLVESERSFNARKLDRAEALASEALGLAGQHPDHISNDSQVRLLLDKIAVQRYEMKLTEGRMAFQAGKLTEAEQLALATIQIQADYANVLEGRTEGQALLLQVKEAQHGQLIREGKSFLDQGLHQAALNKLEAAQKIEAEHAVPKDPYLFVMIQSAAKPVILYEIQEGKDKAEANQLEEARMIGQHIIAMQKQYELEEDAEIVGAFSGLRESIFNQECLNAQAEYEQALEKARTLRAQKDYVAAEAAYADAFAISNQNQACGLSIAEGQAEQKALQPAAQYQRLKANALQQIDRRNFGNGIKEYLQAGDYFVGNSVASFGLSHVSLFDLAMDHNKRDFKLAVARHFADQGEEISSLKLVKRLLRDGYPKGAMKNLMVQIGSQLATKDFSENPDRDWKNLALSYTDGNKSLKKLYKGYKKQWKRLD